MLPFGRRQERDLHNSCCVEAQDSLIDVMSDQNREIDELDYLFRDVLRSAQASAPDSARTNAALRARIAAVSQSMRWVSWRLCVPIEPVSYRSASYWYLTPPMRIMR